MSLNPSSTSSSSSTAPRGLGLRHTNPPDSHSHSFPSPPSLNSSQPNSDHDPNPNSDSDPNSDSWLSDAEWDLRTGRTIDILQSSLPEFFVNGLMASWDSQTGEVFPARASDSMSMSMIPHIHIPIPIPSLDHKSKGKQRDDRTREPIYSPKIRLSYTPPAPLPHPLPQMLQLEGKPLYFSSAVFVRRSLNTLYSDLKVTLTKVAVSVPKSKNMDPSSNYLSSDPDPNSSVGPSPHPTPHTHPHHRQKSFYIALRLTGTSRVSVTGKSLSQWDVRSTYTFCPYTAQIVQHTVNSIDPAPQKTVYDALYQALGAVGIGGGKGTGGEPSLGAFGLEGGKGTGAEGPVRR
ncbi:hypothetical protein BT96DRAFT_991376 [Gymnopus androsaceus JB14]|uniref:Uncharacterized protein n=1 Tax=Gymnopus androsaceus JB14 TaxID=1447944 RepID=A0A6A4HZ37_9AGAR|nr:hypothetical protein BT96DRAFT_991376 [Gymnopus androsaceus JB14]